MLEHLLSPPPLDRVIFWELPSDLPVEGSVVIGGYDGYQLAAFGFPIEKGNDFWWDLKLHQGHPTSVAFIGISTDTTRVNWDRNYNNQNTVTFYWSGSIYGASDKAVERPLNFTITAGTYRFALSADHGTLFFKNMTSGSAVVKLGLPERFKTGVVRPIVFCQAGYDRPSFEFIKSGIGLGGLG